jgi:hypothetical protein
MGLIGENLETFKATFKFVLENLRIENEPDESTTSFKLELKPGERAIKKLVRKNNSLDSKYKCSMSFCFVNTLLAQSSTE